MVNGHKEHHFQAVKISTYKTRKQTLIHGKTENSAQHIVFTPDIKLQSVRVSAFLTRSPLPPGRPGGPGSPGSPILPWGPCENKSRM